MRAALARWRGPAHPVEPLREEREDVDPHGAAGAEEVGAQDDAAAGDVEGHHGVGGEGHEHGPLRAPATSSTSFAGAGDDLGHRAERTVAQQHVAADQVAHEERVGIVEAGDPVGRHRDLGPRERGGLVAGGDALEGEDRLVGHARARESARRRRRLAVARAHLDGPRRPRSSAASARRPGRAPRRRCRGGARSGR